MRWFILCLLSGCAADGTPTAQMQKSIDVLCEGDAIAQPILVKSVPVVVPNSDVAVTADALLVHPAIVAACANYHSKPTAVSSGKTEGERPQP